MKGVKILLVFFILTHLNPVFSQTKEEGISYLKMGLEALKYGRYNEALSNCEKALKIFKELGIPEYIAKSLNNIGFV